MPLKKPKKKPKEQPKEETIETCIKKAFSLLNQKAEFMPLAIEDVRLLIFIVIPL